MLLVLRVLVRLVLLLVKLVMPRLVRLLLLVRLLITRLRLLRLFLRLLPLLLRRTLLLLLVMRILLRPRRTRRMAWRAYPTRMAQSRLSVGGVPAPLPRRALMARLFPSTAARLTVSLSDDASASSGLAWGWTGTLKVVVVMVVVRAAEQGLMPLPSPPLVLVLRPQLRETRAAVIGTARDRAVPGGFRCVCACWCR